MYNFGTKGCIFNCGEECSGECKPEVFMPELCQTELKINSIDFLNFLETGPLIKRRGLTETISLFKDGNERYNKDALFRKIIDSLCLGEKPEKIIDNLIDIINNQQDYMENLIRKDK